ncbi:hypothetical protein Tco_0496708 [Tanacetum coccineum]
MPNVMLVYHDQWDKVSVAMTCVYMDFAENKILVYPDSDEEDEEYCSLSSLLPGFQTPQPCAILNHVHHNNHSEIDIEIFQSIQYTPKLPLDEEESSFDEILDDLFKIGVENIKKIEHEVPNMCDDINDYEDCDQENGELIDLPTFSATNEIASDSEQVEENIDIAEEKEEVPMKDVEMDDNHDIDHSGMDMSNITRNQSKRTRERMSDQEAKEIKAEAREIMPQPSTVNCS